MPENQATRCPFCCCQRVQVLEVDDMQYAVVCRSCGSIGPMGLNQADAERLWNIRCTAKNSECVTA